WPRLREITDGRWMMDMHGMFYEFPKTFSAKDSGGVKPIGSHLRYVPDFCNWNGKLVLATDETSIQGNKLAGQPQSNLWFGDYTDLKTWGPASGYGGPWIGDSVQANVASDPYLIAGFDRRIVHLAVGREKPQATTALRATDQQKIAELPARLAKLPRVTVDRGDWHKPAPGFSFCVDAPVTVFLAVDRRGNPSLDPQWQPTDLSATWGRGFVDRVYSRRFDAGRISIPANPTQHAEGSFGMPHAAFVRADNDALLTITKTGAATVTRPSEERNQPVDDRPVSFTMEVDRNGTGVWTHHATVSVAADGYVAHVMPSDLDATWIRFKTDRDCVATAMLHQTTSRFIDGTAPENRRLFAGLAEVDDADATGALLYAAKRNRNLRVVSGDRFFEFTKHGFEFQADSPDEKLKELLHVDQEFTVDDASVVLKSEGRTYRLPKGDAAFDRPFASGWPRTSREVESERHLANIHGTFYEVPLITNGRPPAWNQMRPVSSHRKQITDFCTWNGLLVLSGVKTHPAEDGHVFHDTNLGVGLWFGGIDDLWKLGKPVGHGGPWRNTTVNANTPSDPYLMTGYDQKTVRISHDHPQPVAIALQVDIEGNGLWVTHKRFTVPTGMTTSYEFPPEFSAYWVRTICDTDTTATVQFQYQ
ncbi:MAG: sulfatase, partial [Planctomycetota bacterium]